jgi:hypothetical membrane protein
MLKQISAIISLLAFQAAVYSQPALPVLKSNTSLIDLKINGKPINGKWVLMPERKPDHLILERSLNDQQVIFNTAIDSMSFIIYPDSTKDFVIILNGRDSSYTQIRTFHTPFFQRGAVRIPFIILLVAIVALRYAWRKRTATKQLLYLGIIVPVLFWGSTIIAGLLHGQYSHSTMVVSDLGALETGSEVFMAITTMLCGILTIFFITGLYRVCKEIGISVIPVLTIWTMAISFVWAAVFPKNHDMHGTLGPLPLIMCIGELLTFVLWRGKQFQRIRMLSLLSFGIFLLCLLRFIPVLQDNYQGLVQRFIHLGWSAWFISLAVCFRDLSKAKK